ncbi:serine/threonine-protein kinase [Mycobacterium sp. 2YAF39]|uniref:serine/threonine-protein kinase n=1 Tax=Mycobacterium sp. 2YAF39 TaxID=3233033 RepID=UPI003F972813
MEGTPFGRYRLVELLGQGGMGEVWRALDTETNNRTVAIKLLAPQLAADDVFVQRFRREADAAARLSNPHIIPIHNYGEIDGRLYVDMRLIEGRDLQEVLAAGPLPPARSVEIVGQIAKALQAAHRVGLVHRDVKPSNILVDQDDYAYLIDFGIATDVSRAKLTKTGMLVGTLAYMAPERFTTGSADAGADVYSLACVLHECLTGMQPYPGDSAEQQISGHLTQDPPKPSRLNGTIPEAFDAVIARGMAKDPAARFSSTGELATAASAVAASRPMPPSLNPAPRPLPGAHQVTTPWRNPASPVDPAYVGPARPEPVRQQGRGRLILAAAAVATFGATALIGAILIARNNDTDQSLPAPVPSTNAETTSKPSGTTATPPQLPSLPGTDAQGFVDYAGARCGSGSTATVMGRTTQSVFVVCEIGPANYYYRGVRLSDGAAIELANAVRSSGGFDVTNPTDGTWYQVTPDKLSITTPDGQVFTEPMIQFAAAR